MVVLKGKKRKGKLGIWETIYRVCYKQPLEFVTDVIFSRKDLPETYPTPRLRPPHYKLSKNTLLGHVGGIALS